MRLLPFLLVLLLLICVASVGFWLLGSAADPSGPAPKESAPVRSELGTAPVPLVHLVVLNGTTQQDLAGAMSLRLGGETCVVDRVGNAPHGGFARTLLVNRRLDPARLDRLAARLGGVPVITEHDPRASEDAVLVLGADHAAVLAALGGSESQ
jgi:hypothetical protein